MGLLSPILRGGHAQAADRSRYGRASGIWWILNELMTTLEPKGLGFAGKSTIVVRGAMS